MPPPPASAADNQTGGPATILPDPLEYRRMQKAASRLRQFALDVHDVLASWVTARDGCPPVWRDETSVAPVEILRRLNYVLQVQAQQTVQDTKDTVGAPSNTNNGQTHDQRAADESVVRKNECLRAMCKQLRDMHQACHQQLNLKQTDLAQMQQQLDNVLSQVQEVRQQEHNQSVPSNASFCAEGRAEARFTQQQEHAQERALWQQTCDRLSAQLTRTSAELEHSKKQLERVNRSLDESNRHVRQLQQVNQQQAHTLVAAKHQATSQPPQDSTVSPPSVPSVRSTDETRTSQSDQDTEQWEPVRQVSDWSTAPIGINSRLPPSTARRIVPLNRRFNKDSKALVSAKPSTLTNGAAAETYGICERRDLSKEISAMVDEIYELMEKDAVLFGDAEKMRDFELMLYQFQKKVKDLLRTNDCDSPSCVTTPDEADDELTIKDNRSTTAASPSHSTTTKL